MDALSDRRITTITRPEHVVIDDNWRDPARTRFDLGYNFYAETTFIKKDAEKAQPQFTPAGTTVTRRRLQGKQTAPSAESGARGMVPESEQPKIFQICRRRCLRMGQRPSHLRTFHSTTTLKMSMRKRRLQLR